MQVTPDRGRPPESAASSVAMTRPVCLQGHAAPIWTLGGKAGGELGGRHGKTSYKAPAQTHVRDAKTN